MTELSHEDIKNAILHAGDSAELASKPETDQPTLPGVEVAVPNTPYEGFIGSEPDEEERLVFRAAREQVHAHHKSRGIEHAANNRRPSRRAIIGGSVAGLLLTGLGSGIALSRSHSSEDSAQASEVPVASAPVNTEKKPTETKSAELLRPADFELKSTEVDPMLKELGDKLTQYVTEKDFNRSEVMLTGLMAENMDEGVGKKWADVWRQKRTSVLEFFRVMKQATFKKGTFVVSLELEPGELYELDHEVSEVNVPIILKEETNFDEPPYNNPYYDFTKPTMLRLTNDHGIYHVDAMLKD